MKSGRQYLECGRGGGIELPRSRHDRGPWSVFDRSEGRWVEERGKPKLDRDRRGSSEGQCLCRAVPRHNKVERCFAARRSGGGVGADSAPQLLPRGAGGSLARATNRHRLRLWNRVFLDQPRRDSGAHRFVEGGCVFTSDAESLEEALSDRRDAAAPIGHRR